MELEDLAAALKGAHKLLATAGDNPMCSRCRQPTDLSASFCRGCGARLVFDCPRCRQPSRHADAFCQHCGFELTTDEVERSISQANDQDEKVRQRLFGPLDEFTDLKRLNAGRCDKYMAIARADGGRRFLKSSSDEQVRQLLTNEGRALASVEHPNVVRCHGVHSHFDQVLLELEHVATRSLRFPLSIERLVSIMHQLASALAAVHATGYVHGDVKPQNILVRDSRAGEPTGTGGPDILADAPGDGEGNVHGDEDDPGDEPADDIVLIDFEVAQPPGRSLFNAYTPMFSAPEQIVGDHFDFRADVYSFGVTLYLLFVYDRVPSPIDLESSSSQQIGALLKAAPKKAKAVLSSQTMVGGFHAGDIMYAQAHSEDETLGAKYFFMAELERIATVNRRLDLTGELLALVGDATEIDPERRPADGAVLVERIERIRSRLDQGVTP